MKLIDRTYLLVSILLGILTTYYIAIPISTLGVSHLRIIDAINTDEGDLLAFIMHVFRQGDFDLGSSPYGILYYNLCLFSAYVLSWFGEVTHSRVIVIARLISFSFLLGNAILIGLYVKRFRLGEWGIAFALSLLGSQVLIRYGLMLHPDIIQLFFITAGLFFISSFLENGKWKYFVFSIGCAALAFSSKYSGILLFPFIGLAALVKFNSVKDQFPLKKALIVNIVGSALVYLGVELFYTSSFSEHLTIIKSLSLILSASKVLALISFVFHIALLFSPKLKAKLWCQYAVYLVSVTYLIGGIFLLSFLIAAPQGFVGFRFINSFLIVIGGHSEGHWFKETAEVFGWFYVLFQSKVIPTSWLVLSVLGLVLLAFEYKWKEKNWFSPQLLPFYWIVLFMIVLLQGVGSKFSHFLIPIIPFFFIYIAFAFSKGIDFIGKKISENRVVQFRIVVLVLVAGLVFKQGYNYKVKQFYDFENSSRIAVGNWFNENVKEEVTIITDKYTYIPPKEIYKHQSYFGISTTLITEVNPDYLAITDAIYNRFTDSSRVDDYLHGREVFMDRTRLYNQLLNNTHTQYVLVQDFGGNKIYKRR